MSTKMTQDKYIADMMTEQELETGPSEVAGFYAGCNVLLTGGSGFLGRLLIERILRSFPDVNTLFLLVREKKGKSPGQRFQELFEDVIATACESIVDPVLPLADLPLMWTETWSQTLFTGAIEAEIFPVFDRLRRERPRFARKVVLIEGDMAKVGLGLSPEQKSLLRSTHIIIHGAATVRFDAKISTATNINVRGTKEMLSIAKEMPDLKAFVHVSTAYCNCVQKEIDEQFYTPPIDYDNLLHLVDILDEAALDHLTPVLLGEWPNTYAFTKAVAEDVVRRSTLPVCIVRPSIIIATSKEPVAGWINNIYGPTGVVIAGGLGLIRTMICDEKMVTDLIPGDYVVNGIILAAWDIAKTRSINFNITDSTETQEMREPPIYNVVSSCQNPITWKEYMMHNFEKGSEIPSVLCAWPYCMKLCTNPMIYRVYEVLLHLIPAAIVDTLAWLTGRKPMLWKAYKKISKFNSVLGYFTLKQWRFHNKNVLRLMDKLNPSDRIEFDLDIGSLNWEEYVYSQVRGLRVYILKDPLSTVPQGQARYAKLNVANFALITALCGLLLWLLWTVLRSFFAW